MTEFFAGLFTPTELQRRAPAHSYGDEETFNPKKTVVTRDRRVMKSSMMQVYPPISGAGMDAVKLKDDGTVSVESKETGIVVGSSVIDIKEVSENKESTGEHLYKSQVTRNDDVVGQAVVYTKDTPVNMSTDEYDTRVRVLAGSRYGGYDDHEEGFNILDLDTPIGGANIGGQSLAGIDTPVGSVHAGYQHLASVGTPIAGANVGGQSIVGIDTSVGSVHAGYQHIASVGTPIAGANVGGQSIAGIDTSVGSIHAGCSVPDDCMPMPICEKCKRAGCRCQKNGDTPIVSLLPPIDRTRSGHQHIASVETPIIGANVGGQSIVGVDTSIGGIHAGCYKPDDCTLVGAGVHARCKCHKPSNSMRAGARYGRPSNERQHFTEVLERTENRINIARVELAQQETPKHREKIHYMITVYNEMFGLVVMTKGHLDETDDSDVPALEKGFYAKLRVLNEKLKIRAGPHRRHVHVPEGLTHTKNDMIQRSVEMEREIKTRARSEIAEKHPERSREVEVLLKKLSVRFDQFRIDVAKAPSYEELERIRSVVYFGDFGYINTTKKKIGRIINS